MIVSRVISSHFKPQLRNQTSSASDWLKM